MTGLNTWTRFRAIRARRSRRISSSLLPENMGPHTTSIQPILPVIKSMINGEPLYADAAAGTVFANHHGILNRLGIAFDGDGGNRVVGRSLGQAREARAELVLREFHSLAGREQL